LRLVYDLRLLTGQMHGMARYALELLKALLEGEPALKVEVILRSPEQAGCLPADGRLKTWFVDLPPYGLSAQLKLPPLLGRRALDLYHCPFYAPPVLFKGPMVFTVHDLIHLRFPRDHGLKYRLFYRAVVGPAARRAQAVFTVSEHSKKDLVELLGVDPDRVAVTPNAVGPAFKPLPEQRERQTAKRPDLPERYFFSVGNAKPHKNLAALVKAHQMLTASPPEGAREVPPLVMVGVGPGELAGAEPGERLILRPRMEDVDLARAYGGALAVVIPSLYEGFGLPALEALACGAPLVCSNLASLPEVVGQAALLCPPEPAALAQAMGRVLTDPGLRASLAQAGPPQAQKFSWRRTAGQTLEVYRRIGEGRWP